MSSILISPLKKRADGYIELDKTSEVKVPLAYQAGVTVAVPLGSRLVSNDEILTEMDRCFKAVAMIRSAMIKDGRNHPLMKRLSDTHDILPFTAPDIARSIGSTFSFHLRSLDMLCAK